MDSDSVFGFLAGRWTGEEQVAPSRWMQGGVSQATIENEIRFGGAALVHEYQTERDGRIWFSAHGVLTKGATSDAVGLFWFDSFGFLPTEAAQGTWDGRSLIFTRNSRRGSARHTYTFVNPDEYLLHFESSADTGTMKTILEGVYRKLT